MENSIDAVVVTYNRLPLLKECLKALLNQRENLSSIFVINN
ncbi:glycosyltransferase [Lacticaseibacillus rhamnosus]|nr:glycosyltransferase [Lacticaseibacillus rhamnosus]